MHRSAPLFIATFAGQQPHRWSLFPAVPHREQDSVSQPGSGGPTRTRLAFFNDPLAAAGFAIIPDDSAVCLLALRSPPQRRTCVRMPVHGRCSIIKARLQAAEASFARSRPLALTNGRANHFGAYSPPTMNRLWNHSGDMSTPHFLI